MTTTSNPFRAGLVQHCAGRDVDRNIEEISALIRHCAEAGAQFVSTPEMSHLLETSAEEIYLKTTTQDQDRGVQHFASLAAELGLWLNIGSLAIQPSEGMLCNRSFLFAPDGQLAATYDKIHMFDVRLNSGEKYRESKRYTAGTRAVIADLPWGKLGMSICYDMRFPGLYRQLAQAGADFLTVPSAFTVPTGKAHWHALLRARAIETGCFVFAAAQIGEHECGRKTYGHSLIISPWGEILNEANGGAGIIVADVDPNDVEAARAKIPSLSLEQEFELVSTKTELKAVS
ncbi:MAG: carbon-nitrogen hydrolase family protein [Rhizobiales bacterium]|nr:carbon-nitrogen hydrolase family protein [Hyphomicrobiales bacterium]